MRPIRAKAPAPPYIGRAQPATTSETTAMKKLLPTIMLAAMVAACSAGPPPPPPPPPWTPTGTYDVSIDAMGMQLGGVLDITETDGEFSGSLGTDMGVVDLNTFTVDTDSHEVTFVGDSPDFSLTFQIMIEEGELIGQFEMAGMGNGAIMGTKRAGTRP